MGSVNLDSIYWKWMGVRLRACVRLPHVYTRVKSTSQNGPNTFSRIVCSSRSLAGWLDSLAWSLGKLMECTYVYVVCVYMSTPSGFVGVGIGVVIIIVDDADDDDSLCANTTCTSTMKGIRTASTHYICTKYNVRCATTTRGVMRNMTNNLVCRLTRVGPVREAYARFDTQHRAQAIICGRVSAVHIFRYTPSHRTQLCRTRVLYKVKHINELDVCVYFVVVWVGR